MNPITHLQQYYIWHFKQVKFAYEFNQFIDY